MSDIIDSVRKGNLEVETWYDYGADNVRDFENAFGWWAKDLHRNYDFHEDAAETLLDSLRHFVPCDADGEELDDIATLKWLADNPSDQYLVRPVFMYDHSGLSFSLGEFSCHWDSGCMGFFVGTPASFEALGITWSPERAQKMLESEVKALDEYHVYGVKGYTIRKYEKCECCGEERVVEEDSCGGFYGADYIVEMKYQIPSEYAELFDKL